MKKQLLALVSAAALCAGLMGPVSAAGQTFTDVPQGHWAYESVDYAVDKGYFSGTGVDTFSPDYTMTRAMLWTVLSRMDNYTGTSALGQPWYKSGQDWVVKNGISDGTNPDADITREQFASMLYNFARHAGRDTSTDSTVLNQFVDRSSIASYAVDAMAWAVTHGIVSGTTSTTISPAVVTTRAQAATMLMRFDRMDENGETVNPGQSDTPAQTADYTTTIRVIDVPPLYPGDPIEIGHVAYVAIQSDPFAENLKAGVEYTLTCADPSMVTIHQANEISPGEICYMVEGLKAGKAVLTAVGSDGFRGSVTITITDPENENTGTTSSVDWGTYAELKQEVVKLINEERNRIGLNTLEVSPKVMQAAEIRVQECTTLCDHTRPDGTSYNTVFKDVKLSSGGNEILARGQNVSVETVVDAWIASPGHYKSMTDSEVNYIGVGIAEGANGTMYYIVELCVAGD